MAYDLTRTVLRRMMRSVPTFGTTLSDREMQALVELAEVESRSFSGMIRILVRDGVQLAAVRLSQQGRLTHSMMQLWLLAFDEELSRRVEARKARGGDADEILQDEREKMLLEAEQVELHLRSKYRRMREKQEKK